MMLMAEITWLRSLQSQPKLASDGIIHTESIDWYRFVVDIMWERSKLIYWYTEISLWAMNNVRKNRKIDGVVKERKCSCWVMSNSLGPHGRKSARFLCPWNSLGKNTGVDCHSLLQGIFPDPGIEPGSPALQADSLPSEPPERVTFVIFNSL